ncbi:MAG: hypothetical protein IK077_11285, partial [Thermoguttaceae bacterium]|nr:hypothetical protein [Thermoguttaceae bacterium]
MAINHNGRHGRVSVAVAVDKTHRRGFFVEFEVVYEFGVGYRLYLDGALKSEKTCTSGGFVAQRNFSLGKKNWNSFLGRMADVSLFRVALPQERIAEYAKRRLLG